MKNILYIICFFIVSSCQEKQSEQIVAVKKNPFLWESANVYFLLTDRFNNGDTSNDINFNRKDDAAKLRGFKGGDIKGVTQKINEGYFTKLGINAIWMTPIVEQIHAGTDEGTGKSYGFHGYWTKDWTAIDPNFGSKADLKELIETAHKNGIRILLDAVINHTGPVTEEDPVWPSNWVRTAPQCTYDSYEHNISCTLVKNLPDIKTESNEVVELPKQLVVKWKKEGRYEEELKELDAFFYTNRISKSASFLYYKMVNRLYYRIWN
jgi:alpha-amylase